MNALALNAVSVAVYTTLNVAGLLALAPGGVHDSLPQNRAFPMLFFEVSETDQLGGFGTRPGAGQLPEVRIRLMVYTQEFGMKTAQQVMNKAIELLRTPPVVAGFRSWEIFCDATTPLPESVIAGDKVQELVTDMRLYVEEGAAA